MKILFLLNKLKFMESSLANVHALTLTFVHNLWIINKISFFFLNIESEKGVAWSLTNCFGNNDVHFECWTAQFLRGQVCSLESEVHEPAWSESQTLRRDFKLILWSRLLIGWRSGTWYLIEWKRHIAKISLKTPLSSNGWVVDQQRWL